MKDMSEVDGLIIRNLTDIELAHERIEGQIQERLEREAGRIFRDVAGGAGWHCKAESLDDEFWMAKPAWKMRRKDSDDEADYLLVPALDWDSTKADTSWAGTIVGSRGSRLLLRLSTDKFTPARWSRFLEEVAVRHVVERLRLSGLVHDPNNKSESFAIEVTAEPEKLAAAFEGEEQFDTAFRRLRGALEKIVAMEDDLEELAQLVRQKRA